MVTRPSTSAACGSIRPQARRPKVSVLMASSTVDDSGAFLISRARPATTSITTSRASGPVRSNTTSHLLVHVLSPHVHVASSHRGTSARPEAHAPNVVVGPFSKREWVSLLSVGYCQMELAVNVGGKCD